ncbi:N-6-adenine-methyltransferase [Cenarchaeum symbiosum A]|uniref:N-6-adenine-methyltransferase n=1 Tax=Cenarchaeum symbiosum (strain A) TaxID=414004 RepID=A0RV83_CENSY|nr:N-6-adenine-methyltransferase [Cenarchaeum symbiosum A]
MDSVTAGRHSTTENKDWGTPPVYVDAVRRVLGGVICLDPCSNPRSVVGAEVEYMLPARDGLEEKWNYPKIYVNPPYGADRARGTKISDWLRRCAEAGKSGSEVLALVPVATNTSHWKMHVFGRADAVCFLRDTRLRFLVDGRDGGKGAPMACAMVYYGGNVRRFSTVFREHGAVVDLRDLKVRKRHGRPGVKSRPEIRA